MNYDLSSFAVDTLLRDLADLHRQATTEHSHYCSAAVIGRALATLTAARAFLDRAAATDAAIERMKSALLWYAESPPRGQFVIIDDQGEFVSDMADWGERARAAIGETEGSGT